MSDTTAPVTAEDLRERLIETLIESWKTGTFRNLRQAAARDVDTLLAALAGDPGDLPARMAEAMRKHRLDERSDDPPGLTICVCGEQVKDWKYHLSRAAMSVRWEDNARQAAEMERLRAELAAVLDHDREAVRMLNAAEADLERLVAVVAERDALKAAMEITAADALAHRLCAMRETGILRRAEQAEAALRDLEQETQPSEEIPTDPAELAEMWRFLIGHWRWQRSMAIKFDRQRMQFKAERDALKAAIYNTRIAHVRESHATKPVLPSCAVCRAFMALSRDIPAKPDSREEIERRLAALAAPESNEDNHAPDCDAGSQFLGDDPACHCWPVPETTPDAPTDSLPAAIKEI